MGSTAASQVPLPDFPLQRATAHANAHLDGSSGEYFRVTQKNRYLVLRVQAQHPLQEHYETIGR